MDLKTDSESHVLYVKNTPIITKSDVMKAEAMDSGGLNITLTPAAAEKFDVFASKSIGSQVAFIINDTLVAAPIITSGKFAGRILIDGNFSDEQARELAQSLSQHETEQGAAANP